MMATSNSLKRSPVPDEGDGSNKRIKTSATPPPSNFEEDLAFLQVRIIIIRSTVNFGGIFLLTQNNCMIIQMMCIYSYCPKNFIH